MQHEVANRPWVLFLAVPFLLLAWAGCSDTSSPGSGEDPSPGLSIPGQLDADALAATSWGSLFAHTVLGVSPVAGDGSFTARFDSSAVRASLLIALADGTPILGARVSLATDTILVGAAETATLLLGLDPLLWGVPAEMRETTLAALAEQLGPAAAVIAAHLGGEDEDYLVDTGDLEMQTSLASLLRDELAGIDAAAGDPYLESGGDEASPVLINPQACFHAYALGDYYSNDWTAAGLLEPAALRDPLQIDAAARHPLELADGRYELLLYNGRLGCALDLGRAMPDSADALARQANLALGCGSLLQDVYLALPEISWLTNPGEFALDDLEDLAGICTAWEAGDSLAFYRETLGMAAANAAWLTPDVDDAFATMLAALTDAMALASDELPQGRFAGDLCASADTLRYHFEVTGSALRLIDPPEVLIVPANLTATLGDSCVLLEWDDLASNEEGYAVQRARFGGFSDIANLPADSESYTDSSVVGGNTYRYHVRAFHQGLRSDASDEVEIAIPEPPDETPPLYLWDLSTTLVGSNRILLTWTTTGDDANAGLASQYDLRYASEPITESIWELATQVVGEPDPVAPGNQQSLRLDGFDYDTRYYFSMKVGDEVPNWSLLSNPTDISTTVAPIEPEMLEVPAGSFTMGSDPGEGGGDEEPEHYPYLNAFMVDKYEVTNAMYADALNWALDQGLIEVEPHERYGNIRKPGGGEYYILLDWSPAGGECRIMREFGIFEPKPGWDNHPVVNPTWHGSAAYCNWRSEREGLTPCYDLTTWACDYAVDGYRLPSEAEWEKAGRGDADERIYPWPGMGLSCSLANRFGCVGHTAAVDDPFYEGGVSTYGGWHMAGNASEWCNDWYSYTYYEVSPLENPRGPDHGMQKLLRGASWLTQELPRVTWRKSYPPTHSWTSIGFRCVRRP